MEFKNRGFRVAFRGGANCLLIKTRRAYIHKGVHVTENTEVSPGLQGRLNRGWIELGVFHLVGGFKFLFYF